MKIIEYFIVAALNHAEIEKKVNYSISKGYQPLGGVSITLDTSGAIFIVQAMVKYDE